MSLPGGAQVWRDTCEAESTSLHRLYSLWREISEPEQVLREALKDPRERRVALHLLLLLCDDRVRVPVFDAIVALAGYQHSDILLCRQVLKCMPHRWVVEHIEPVVDGVLAQTDGKNVGESYQRYAELYEELDPGLSRRLVDKALKHENPDVRDVGRSV